MSSVSDALRDLQRQFVVTLPSRIAALHAQYQKLNLSSWQTAEVRILHHQLHSLIGSAGTFGMQSLSVAARQVETQLKTIVDIEAAPDADAWGAIGAELTRIEQLAHSRIDTGGGYLEPSRAEPCPERAPIVHLVEDDPEQADYLSRALRDDGYQVRVFTALDDFRSAQATAGRPDAIVLDMVFPESESGGIKLLNELKAEQACCPPVVFVSMRDDLDARLAAYRAGASCYLLKPVAPIVLIDLLNTLTGRIPQVPYRVLLVDDDPLLLQAEAAMLRAAGMVVQAVSQPRDTLDMLDSFIPDVVVLDVYMPEVSGPELAAIIRERDNYLSLPILFLSAETDMSLQLQALSLGGDDFLVKPVQAEHLISAVTARARRSRQNAAVQQRLHTALYEREREHLALDHHAIVSIADSKGDITDINDKFCEISGYSRDELLGQNHRIVKSGEHPPEFYHDIWRTITAGKVWQGEICNRCKDGSLYWVESTITPFMDEKGKPYQYVSVRTDITHVKAAETTQRKQNAMRAVMGEAAAGLLAADAEAMDTAIEQALRLSGEHLGADRAYLCMLTGNDARLSNSHEWCAPEIAPRKDTLRDIPLETVPWLWTQILLDQSIIITDVGALPAEARAEKAMFEALEVRALCGFPIRRGGKTLGFIGFDQVGVTRDWDASPLDLLGLLAGLIGSALLRTVYERDIQRQQRFTQDILDSVSANIAVLDRDGVIIAVNEPWQRFTRCNATQAGAPVPNTDVGAHYLNVVRQAESDDPQDAGGVADGIESVINGRAPSFRHEYPCHSPSEDRWFEMTVMPMSSEGSGVVISHADITERKLAEQGVEIAKERLRRGQVYANIGTWDWNMRSGELYWTERIAPLFGYPEGDLDTSYENFIAAVHPDDRQMVIDAVNACVERDEPYEIEHRVVWPDGTVRWLLERGAVVRDVKGKPLSMLGVVQDIDDRKRAEVALAERERQLLEAQRLASIGNWSADLANGELLWSDEIYRIFGYEPGDITPSVEIFHAAIHPDDRELVHQSEQLAEKTGRHDVVHRILRPDGSIRYVHELAQMQFDESGKPLRLTGTVQDVTEIKQAEQDLLIFRRVFDATEQGIGVADVDGYLIYSNPAHDRLHGYEPGECSGMHFTRFFSEETMQWAPETIRQAVTEGRSWSGLLPIVCQDGSEVVTASNVGFIAGVDGKPQYLFNIMSDYSPELARQQQLAQAKEEADRANQAKSEFLSSMSHELRTPMNAILGFGQLMEYDDTLPEDHQDSVNEILKAGNHLLELISEVLDLAKVESGNIDLSLEPVEVCAVVDECLALVGPLADQRGIGLRHQGLEDAAVRADRTRLKQVLLNLLSNAIKYNRQGGSVMLNVQQQADERLRIQVIDTGPGIPADKLTGLFEPFNRLGAEAGEIEGTGIGLTITRRIVEMMGGIVDAQSEVGVGSTFWIELPLESLADSSQRHHSSSGIGKSDTHSANEIEHTVLYIEDNPSNIKLIAQLFGRMPHIHLLTAHTPELGIELSMARQPDLILLDINMPGMDGYQVLQVLKAESRLKTIPIIAITANAMPRDIERGIAAGFTDYLTKPLNVGQFLDTVKCHLAKLDKGST
ncbi:MAG: PAS domain-containing protein [Alcanivoracaceae bacterium]|jgi:PAS domain S-box-containing protein|nr:PAS domain-containing protein [Alcanivoracaceae bacterium]